MLISNGAMSYPPSRKTTMVGVWPPNDILESLRNSRMLVIGYSGCFEKHRARKHFRVVRGVGLGTAAITFRHQTRFFGRARRARILPGEKKPLAPWHNSIHDVERLSFHLVSMHCTTFYAADIYFTDLCQLGRPPALMLRFCSSI